MLLMALIPQAAGPYVPDAFDDNADGRGITWGLTHSGPLPLHNTYSFLFRFDCDLSLDVHDANFKQPNARFAADHEHLINNKLISIHKVLNIFVFLFKSIKN
jgi:hypothetical protein